MKIPEIICFVQYKLNIFSKNSDVMKKAEIKNKEI